MIDPPDLARLKDAVPLASLFRAHGVELKGDPSRGLRGLCPFHEERTPSFHVREAQGYFKCFGCGAGGDVLEAIQRLAGCSFPAAVEELRRIAGRPLEDLPPPRPRPEPAAPVRADLAEVPELWEASASILSDREAVAWASRRGLEPERLAKLDLVRVLPPPGPGYPLWAGCGSPWRPWPAAGYRLAWPLFDSNGTLAGLRSRCLTPRRVKALGGKGLSPRGLVLANALGRQLLGGHAGERSGLLIVEGETDLAAASLRYPSWAVLGIGSGWWTRDLAARVSNGSRVVILTDDDPAGDRYAAELVNSLGDRCEIRRSFA